ncbi:MAG: DinB family protein [Chloroflexi bacterium]|nr:MAG: DinB family protein [Chloroflexota bacterium]
MDNTALTDYRGRLLEKILQSAGAFCAACRESADAHQPVDGGWSLHQIAAHVRDVDAQVYGLRIRRTAAEDYPTFPNFDGDAWAATQYRADEPLENILGEFETSIRELVGWLETLPGKTWGRLGRHTTQGERTLQTWVERSLAHVEEHLHTITHPGSHAD